MKIVKVFSDSVRKVRERDGHPGQCHRSCSKTALHVVQASHPRSERLWNASSVGRLLVPHVYVSISSSRIRMPTACSAKYRGSESF